MKTRRRTASAAGLLAIALTVSACGSAQGEDGADQTLRVWFPGNLAEEIALINDEIVPAFEEQHSVNVEVEFVDWGDLSTRLSTAFAGGTTPDIFGHGNAAAASYAANDRVIALDGYLEQLTEEEVADLTFLEEGVVEGEHIIMPLRGFGHLLAYRTDLFEEAGLDADAAPQNWEELRATAETLTERDGATITRAGVVMSTQNPTSMTQAFGNFLFQAGGSFLNEDNSAVAWDSQQGVAALEFLVDMYVGDNPVADGLGESITNAGAQYPLVTGRAAMAFVDEATLKTIHEQAPDVAESIVVAPPLQEAVPAAFGGAGNGLFISADSTMQDEAWEFIQFLLEPENAKAYIETVGGIPALASLAADPDLAGTPYIAPYMEAANHFHGNPNIEQWTQVRDLLGDQVEAALHGVTSPQEALETAATEANALLNQD